MIAESFSVMMVGIVIYHRVTHITKGCIQQLSCPWKFYDILFAVRRIIIEI